MGTPLALGNVSDMPLETVHLDEAPPAAQPLDAQMKQRYQRVALENRCTLDELTQILGTISKKDLLQSFANFYGVPSLEFSSQRPAPAEILKHFTRDFLAYHRVVPIADSGGEVLVLMENPRDVVTQDDLSLRMGGRRLRIRVGIREDILAYLDHFYGNGQSMPDALAPFDLDQIVRDLEADLPFGAAELAVEGEETNENAAPIVRLVNEIIREAQQKGASDIHFEPDPEGDTVIRFRIDGVCGIHSHVPRRYARAIASRIKIMSGLDIAERRLPQDGKIKFRANGAAALELRVSTMPNHAGTEDVVLRLLASSRPLPLDVLGMRPENLARFRKMIDAPYGLVLCVGPTGSGKTTTLHSALGAINTPELKIWTAEDPVEITQSGVRQVQVFNKIGLTFARAMRGFLRLDPDVIMIGEMRDMETAATAVEASLTGHLVFSTLHTNSAPETITRLLDMGVDPFSFGDSLLGVLAQRLVRKICPECRKTRVASAEESETLQREFGGSEAWTRCGMADPSALSLSVGAGCDACGLSGYRGRIAIHELLNVNEEIRQLIYRKCKGAEIRRQAVTDGMWTLKQEGIKRVLDGLTDLREIRRAAGD